MLNFSDVSDGMGYIKPAQGPWQQIKEVGKVKLALSVRGRYFPLKTLERDFVPLYKEPLLCLPCLHFLKVGRVNKVEIEGTNPNNELHQRFGREWDALAWL